MQSLMHLHHNPPHHLPRNRPCCRTIQQREGGACQMEANLGRRRQERRVGAEATSRTSPVRPCGFRNSFPSSSIAPNTPMSSGMASRPRNDSTSHPMRRSFLSRVLSRSDVSGTVWFDVTLRVPQYLH